MGFACSGYAVGTWDPEQYMGRISFNYDAIWPLYQDFLLKTWVQVGGHTTRSVVGAE